MDKIKFKDEYETFKNMLAGSFADSDLMGYDDDKEIVQKEILEDSIENPASIERLIKEIKEILALKELPFKVIEEIVGRYFETESDCRNWLQMILFELEKGFAEAHVRQTEQLTKRKFSLDKIIAAGGFDGKLAEVCQLLDNKKPKEALDRILLINLDRIDSEDLSDYKRVLGRVYFENKKWDKSIECYEEVLNREDADEDLKVYCCDMLGNLYFNKEDYDKSAHYFLRAHYKGEDF